MSLVPDGCPTGKEPQVTRELSTLDKCVNELENDLNILEGKLSPILSMPNDDTSGAAGEDTSIVDLAATIRDIRRRAEHMIAKLIDIIARLEI